MDFIRDKIRTTCAELTRYAYKTLTQVDGMEYCESDYKNGNTPPENGWKPFEQGMRLGGKDRHWWFAFHVSAPVLDGEKRLSLGVSTGSEGQWEAIKPQILVYLNGHIEQGIDANHTDVMLEQGAEYDVLLYVYSSMKDGDFSFDVTLRSADIPTEELYYDLFVPYSASECFAPEDPRCLKTLKMLELAADLLDMRQLGSTQYYESVAAARAFLAETFYDKDNSGTDGEVTCIGHTHIDVAWLWPLRQTVEKAQRSFATVLALMKSFPEYRFMSSQPQLYQYVKEQAPELYAEIKQAVADGRWEVEGAAWLEMDTNLTSGESLVRQMLFGKRFMRDEFGVDSKVLWLPDVFGYSAALPQILKKSGVERFMTTKIAWSESNKFPYDSFMWQGLDGSEVFTFFVTTQDRPLKNPRNSNACTYNGSMTPGQVLGTWERYQQKVYNDKVMTTFGYGDGGGGPTREMLMTQRRTEHGIPGIPRTKIRFSGELLEEAERNFNSNCEQLRRTPRWVGELYLEYHRGTYTSIAKNKKNNRKSELLFQRAEALSAAAGLLTGAAYPQTGLNSGWRTILLNQFHDIIPGSSIFEVYEDSDRDYAEVRRIGEAAQTGALDALCGGIGTDGGLFVYNPNGFEADGIADCGGTEVWVKNIPAFGWRIATPETGEKVLVGDDFIENSVYRLELDADGSISSLYDKRAGREVFISGEAGNELRVFEDLPRNYDAWEISAYYKQKMWKVGGVVSVEKVDRGERAGLKVTRKYQSSEIVQEILLSAHGERIDFVTDIDWHEEHVLLKAAFPIDVHTDRATYDVQFGNLQRPTHTNTSWDKAKFEVCAHKWADISEDGYGVSLLNDCKYGHSAEGSTLSLSLLKCAIYPNPQADKGKHSFTYSIVSHTGDFKRAGIIEQAYMLNNPLISRSIEKQSGKLPESYSILSCDSPSVFVETVKKAEDSGDIIVRGYEAFNSRCSATITAGFDFSRVCLCDLMENELTQLDFSGRSVTLPVSNFEIFTLKFTPEKGISE